ncbi:MAG: HAD family hydrolase [Ruminiclostridium sp.]|nr:HAD family hydrolase [Ruminiclostridium sp.]
MKKCIIFDAYGTLISTGSGSSEAAGRIFGKYLPDKSPAEIYAVWKRRHKANTAETGTFMTEKDIFILDLRQLFGEYGINADAEKEVAPMLDSLYGRSPFAETREVLERLGEKYRIYIGSTTDTAPLMSNLDALAFTFDGIYTSEMLRCYKPQTGFYTELLHRTGFAPEECWWVGDSYDDDVEGPGAVGIESFFIDRKGTGYSGNRCGTMKAVIRDLRELIGYLM